MREEWVVASRDTITPVKSIPHATLIHAGLQREVIALDIETAPEETRSIAARSSSKIYYHFPTKRMDQILPPLLGEIQQRSLNSKLRSLSSCSTTD